MGKKAEAPSAGKKTPQISRRAIALLATGALVVLGVMAALVVMLVSRPHPLPVLSPDQLLKEAEAVHFSPAEEPGTGLVEILPANASLPEPSPDLLAVGSPAPDFKLRTPTGEEVRLSSYRGKTVLLEFSSTWCPGCQAEAPHMLRIAKALPDPEFAVLGMNCDSEDPASVYAFDKYFAIPYKTLLDPGGRPGSFYTPGTAGPVTRAYHVSILPAFFVIDAHGRVAWRADGERPTVQIVAELAKAYGH